MATTTPASSGSAHPTHRPDGPARWTLPLALGSAAVVLALGVVRALLSGDARFLVWPLILTGVIVAVLVPIRLMERSGRGIAAPFGTSENRWAMVAFAGVQAVAAGAGAAWAAGAGHTVLAVALGGWVLLSLLGLVAALAGPARSVRGRRPAELMGRR